MIHKEKAPGTAGTAPRARGLSPQEPKPILDPYHTPQNRRAPEGNDTAQGGLLFETQYKDHLWRLEVSRFRGKTFGNWRKWWQKDGEWLPSKVGCTIPLSQIPELHEALGAWLEANPQLVMPVDG